MRQSGLSFLFRRKTVSEKHRLRKNSCLSDKCPPGWNILPGLGIFVHAFARFAVLGPKENCLIVPLYKVDTMISHQIRNLNAPDAVSRSMPPSCNLLSRAALLKDFKKSLIFLLLAFPFFIDTAQAQPQLNFKRIINNWPTIELYFTVGCNGQPVVFTDPKYFKVMESGVEIKNFSLWCPDPNMACAMSVSLVFDVSGSMIGPGIDGAKAAGHAFTDKMDGKIDEAAVLWFNQTVGMLQSMTVSKAQLNKAVDSLTAGGMTAVWDGAYSGLLELINNGVNQCRGVIVLTDGEDNSSSHSPAEVISLANRNRVKVFTIGVGSPINSAQLQSLASMTGGKYYETPNASQLPAIYQEIVTILRQGFQECLITYDAQCMDGSIRTVDLSLLNFCSGSDTKTKSFKALRDTSTFTPVRIKLDTVSVFTGDPIRVPIRMLDAPGVLNTGGFTLTFDSSLMVFDSMSTVGYLLDGVQITHAAIPAGHSFSIVSKKIIQQSGILATVHFHSTTVTQPSTASINIADWVFSAGCIRPVTESGQVRIETNPMPTITAGGPTGFCDGGSVTLSAPDGFSSYLWSTGEKTKSIVVNKSGSHSVTVTDAQGHSGTSASVMVTVWPNPAPVITPAGPVITCAGRPVNLDAGRGYAEYTWSTGAKTRIISVSQSGEYYVAVRDSGGCVGNSQRVTVTVAPLTVTVTADGPTTFCEGGSVRLDAGAGYKTYIWSTGATSRSITVGKAGVYTCTVADSANCSGLSQPVSVTIQARPTALITVVGNSAFCEGDSAILDAGAGYSSYLWSTGALTQRITAKLTGAYYAIVENAAGCRDTSNLVTITVLPRPAKPVISRNANTLAVMVPESGYQWSLNGAAITGATNQTFTVIQIGNYTVTVTGQNGCTATSNPFRIDSLLGIDAPFQAEGIDLYPDPNDGKFVVSVRNENPVAVDITVFNTLGQVVERLRHEHVSGSFRREIDLAGRPAGMYIVHVRTESGNLFRKMCKR
jgi:hypothetical protein